MIKIRFAAETDFEALVDLFLQLYKYYFETNAPTRKDIEDYLRENLFKPHCDVQIIIALDGNKPIGLATFSILYPAPNTTGQLYMKDLFTVKHARGTGVGKSIMKFIAAYGLSKGCSRFDWTAETTNPKALEFYRHIGADVISEKVYFRFSGEKLRSFAKNA